MDDYCEDSASFGCFRVVFIDVVACILILTTFLCSFKIVKFYKSYVFELLPLTTGLLQALFEFLHNFLQKSVILLFTSFYLQVLTFCLVTFSLIRIYFSIKDHPFSEKITNFAFWFLFLFISVVFFLGIGGLPSKIDCLNNTGLNWIMMVVAGFIIAFFCVIFGNLLLREMQKLEKMQNYHTPHLPSKSAINAIFADQNYFKQQKRNIVLLLLSFLIESVFVFIWDLLLETIWTQDLECDDSYIEATNDLGDIYLFLRSFFSLGPCFMMLYVFYYIPIGRHQFKTIEDLHFNFNDNDSFNQQTAKPIGDTSFLENLDLKWKNEESLQSGLMKKAVEAMN